MRRQSRAGCLAVVLVLLVAVGLAAWYFRDELLRRWSGTVEYSEVSPEAAAAAEAKLERLRAQGDTVWLTQVELASLLRYRIADQYPELLQNPSLALNGDTLRLGARVSSERLPDLQELDRVRAFLPDTTRIDIEGRLLSLERGRGAIEIDGVSVAGLPIPQRYYPDVLDRLGRRDEPGLPPTALPFMLPQGVGEARLQNGHLVLYP